MAWLLMNVLAVSLRWDPYPARHFERLEVLLEANTRLAEQAERLIKDIHARVSR
ncbi:MAG: hypothetical protein WEB19_01245 [Acidimicrobiia bacterium]